MPTIRFLDPDRAQLPHPYHIPELHLRCFILPICRMVQWYPNSGTKTKTATLAEDPALGQFLSPFRRRRFDLTIQQHAELNFNINISKKVCRFCCKGDHRDPGGFFSLVIRNSTCMQ